MSDVLHIAQCSLPDSLGALMLGELAMLRANPANELNEIVEADCSRGCGAKVTASRFFVPLTACDECRKKADEEERLEKTKAYWESICPEAYRKTDRQHPDFPKAQYEATKAYTGAESLLFFGPSRSGKTRLAMFLLKRCLAKFNRHVGAMWEEDLETVKTFQDRKQLILRWGRFDLLLLDDALLSGARDERTTSFLKQLLDYRGRHERPSIITSQVGSEAYMEAAKRDGLIRKQDEARVEALLKRIRENFQLVSFDQAKPQTGEEAF